MLVADDTIVAVSTASGRAAMSQSLAVGAARGAAR